MHPSFLAILGATLTVIGCAGSTVPTSDVTEADSGSTTLPTDAAPPPKKLDAGADTAPPMKDSGTCNALVNIGKTVAVVAVSGAAPIPTGGTIVDGTYVLTEATLYRDDGIIGPTGKSVRMTIAVQGGQAESVFDGVNRTATITTIGTTLESNTTCPQVSHDSVGYTATAAGVTTFAQASEGVLVYVFDKQ